VANALAAPAVAAVGGTNVEEAKIEITAPHHGESLTDPNPLGPGSVSYVVRGKLKTIPEGHQIWLLTADERFEQYWPQGFYLCSLTSTPANGTEGLMAPEARRYAFSQW